MLVLF